MVRFDLIIFDCDGVLVDSEPAANRVLARLLTEISLPTSSEESARCFAGRSLAACLHIIETRLGGPVPDHFVATLRERSAVAFRDEIRPVPGVIDALDHLAVPFCVASSGPHEKMRLTLGLTGLLSRFERCLFSACDVERGKPHPDLFLHAARSMGVRPDRCAVVEDSVLGIAAARAAAMAPFGYAGRTHAGDLSSAGAHVVRDMADLPALTGCARKS